MPGKLCDCDYCTGHLTATLGRCIGRMPDETELDGDDDEEILDPAGEPDTYPAHHAND